MAKLKRKATPEEKERILDMSRRGVSTVDIAQQLGLHGQTVNGTVNTARVRGLLPPGQPAASRPAQPIPFPAQVHGAIFESAELRRRAEAAEAGRRDAVEQMDATLKLVTRLAVENEQLRKALAERAQRRGKRR